MGCNDRGESPKRCGLEGRDRWIPAREPAEGRLVVVREAVESIEKRSLVNAECRGMPRAARLGAWTGMLLWTALVGGGGTGLGGWGHNWGCLCF